MTCDCPRMEGGRADWRLSASSPEREAFEVGHVDSDAQAGGIFSLGFHHQQPAHWAACTCLNFHCTPCPLGLGSSLELLSHQDTQFLIFGSWKPFSALASCLLSLCWCDHFLMPLPLYVGRLLPFFLLQSSLVLLPSLPCVTTSGHSMTTGAVSLLMG